MDKEGVVVHRGLLHLRGEGQRGGLFERHARTVAVAGLQVALSEVEAGVLHQLVLFAHHLGEGLDGLGVIASVIAADAQDIEVAPDEGVGPFDVLVEHLDRRGLVALPIGYVAQQAVGLGAVPTVRICAQEGLAFRLDAVVTLIHIVDLHQVIERLLAVGGLGFELLEARLGLLEFVLCVVDVSQVIGGRHAVFATHLLNAGEVIARRA